MTIILTFNDSETFEIKRAISAKYGTDALDDSTSVLQELVMDKVDLIVEQMSEMEAV